MIQRQDSSTVNVFLYMDDTNTPQVVPTFGDTSGRPSAPNFMYSEMDQEFSFPEDIPTPKDAQLAAAMTEALTTGSLTPLIKEELKCSIQSRRLKEGKGELKVNFDEPAPDKLTPEEEEKVKKRRIQNRMAARRFRDRQKCKGTHFQRLCQQLESKNTVLRYELDQLKKEKDDLRRSLMDHLKVCPYPPRYQPYP